MSYIIFTSDSQKASLHEKLADYDSYTMAHPYLDIAFETLKPIITNCGESRIIFIVGPTGVGKTKLRLLIEKWIIESSLSLLDVDRGCIPVASIEARLLGGGLFNFKDHLKRCLYALAEPPALVKNKINYGTSNVYHNLDGELIVKPTILETELGWALEQALHHRRPKIFFIDEAHHLLAVASGRKLTDVPEAIKSLANITQILHGLIGTYDLLTLHDIGDQLSRRSIYIHLPRYNAEFIEDREIWQSIIWNFQHQISTREPPDFLSHWEYLYSRSLGCVGIFKNWSRNAFGEALNENASTVTLKHLEKRALSVGQCRNILKHIKEGEARYAEIEGKTEELYQDLGLRRPPISKQKYSNQSELKSQSFSSQKRKKTVGIRKPTRDSIGTENAI
ncbi:ATP-binding protein [Scytonema hofmannii PCC 7110]|uniref:ATP-binding protein n=2 Tax=Scytonema hofmannii TaxID=34078 RepID=A0A139WY73_9CYAN|nr:ATP-binding protein [Scytonema hofmannii PCC 7110]